MLLYGPPGLGKTTLAYVIGNEMGVPVRATSGPVLEKPGDLAAILTNLKAREVLFIDEIHRMSPMIEEILYPAMEDFELDIMIGQGPGARSVKVPVQPFTLIGATTRRGSADLAAACPLRHRAPSGFLRAPRSDDDRHAIGADSGRGDRRPRRPRRSRAGRVARRESRTGCCAGCVTSRRSGPTATSPPRSAIEALELLEVDAHGFDEADRRLLRTIIDKFGGGPVGLNSLSAAIGEEKDAIEDIYEPYLIQIGFLDRTSRGRIATPRAYEYFGLTAPRKDRLW